MAGSEPFGKWPCKAGNPSVCELCGAAKLWFGLFPVDFQTWWALNPLWKMALQGRKSEFENPWTMTRNQHPFQKYEKSCSLGFLALQSHFPERIQSCAGKGLETGQITDSRQLKKTRISGLAKPYSKGFKARLYGKGTGDRQNHSFTAPHSSQTVGFPALQSHIPKDSKPAVLKRYWE